VHGLEILGGGVVGVVCFCTRVSMITDVVERVPDDVEALTQRHRLDLAEEHLHADLAGRDDTKDGKKHDERRDADGDGEDGARNDLRQRRRQQLALPRTAAYKRVAHHEHDRGEHQLAHRPLLPSLASPRRRSAARSASRRSSANLRVVGERHGRRQRAVPRPLGDQAVHRLRDTAGRPGGPGARCAVDEMHRLPRVHLHVEAEPVGHGHGIRRDLDQPAAAIASCSAAEAPSDRCQRSSTRASTMASA